jgi:hypothetical protein
MEEMKQPPMISPMLLEDTDSNDTLALNHQTLLLLDTNTMALEMFISLWLTLNMVIFRERPREINAGILMVEKNTPPKTSHGLFNH